MMLFEVDWMGGAAERWFRPHRQDIIALPWQDVQTDALTAAQRDGLRTLWTQSAHQEWCAAGAFARLQIALLQARAPVDLIGMSGRFVADEMVHVELASRMAMAYGGGVPLEVDPLLVYPTVRANQSPLLDAVELAVRVSCVGESISLPMVASERAVSADPVSRAVMTRIVTDEAAHASVGWLVLDWALPALDADGRQHILEVARDALEALEPAVTPDGPHRELFDTIVEQRVRRPFEARGLLLQGVRDRETCW